MTLYTLTITLFGTKSFIQRNIQIALETLVTISLKWFFQSSWSSIIIPNFFELFSRLILVWLNFISGSLSRANRHILFSPCSEFSYWPAIIGISFLDLYSVYDLFLQPSYRHLLCYYHQQTYLQTNARDNSINHLCTGSQTTCHPNVILFSTVVLHYQYRCCRRRHFC